MHDDDNHREVIPTNSSTSNAGIFVERELGAPDIQPSEIDINDKTRTNIAYLFAGTFVITITISLIAPFLTCLFTGLDKNMFLEVLKTILPPTVAVVGTITGFYYGAQRK